MKWAIVALTKPSHPSINMRNEAIAERIKPYARIHDFTIMFFSEQTISSQILSTWRNTFNNIANVVTVDTFSRGFNGVEPRFGYKYMCKFFALGKDHEYF